jgi:glycosyltransferase involved in cell wall biosynthesis
VPQHGRSGVMSATSGRAAVALRPHALVLPPRHPYVDRLDGRAATLVHRDATTEERTDPAWIARHARDWDVAHLHLGLVDLDPARVIAAVAGNRDRGVPVAVTVHDVQSPDGRTSLLDVLQQVHRDLAAVITLTEACAVRLRAALDRPVRVIPHGPVLPRSERARLRAHRRMVGGRRPLLVLADDLPSRLGWLEAVEAATRTLHPHRVRLLVHPDHVEVVRRATAAYPAVEVDPTTSPAAVHRAVADARALVLPWRWGGHSWEAELAADVGTPVIATDVGFVRAQHPVRAVRCPDGHVDVDDLAAAYDEDLPDGVPEADRARAAVAFRQGHERLYRRLVLGRTLSRSGQLARS